MTRNIIEKYFDNLAKDWDSYQDCPEDVKRALLERAGISKGDHVLDVACGTGAIAGVLHELTGETVKGVDISGEMISVAKSKYANCSWAQFEHADFLNMEEGFFDDVVIYNAYPHFLDVNFVVEKAARMLKSGGKLVIVHSLSRERINSHHKQHADRVSRPILSPEEEAKHYNHDFETKIAEEDEEHYLLVLEKK